MQRRLKRSLDDVISSRTLTIQSQMLALQAQMDSHFLYNTLTIISIIAEDNDDEQAAAMCIKPVSYTHLDVYKRQMYLCPNAYTTMLGTIIITMMTHTRFQLL